MKKIKYISLILIGLLVISSCKTPESDLVADIKSSANLVVFEDVSASQTQIADGTEYSMMLKVKLAGPTTYDMTGDLTVTIGVDESSTAVEGTHFRIETPTITLAENNNYLALVELVMLTEGIETPLDVSPVASLVISDVSGGSNVIASSKPINVTLNYACPSELAGAYTYVILRDGADLGDVYGTGGVMNVAELGIGTYRTDNVGHWPSAALAPGTPGFTFTDVCGVLDIPEQYLADYWGNLVYSTEPGTVDTETGVVHLVYEVWSSDWSSIYDLTLTPQ